MKSVTYVETQKCYPCPDFTDPSWIHIPSNIRLLTFDPKKNMTQPITKPLLLTIFSQIVRSSCLI
jgi:hypothetical protein